MWLNETLASGMVPYITSWAGRTGLAKTAACWSRLGALLSSGPRKHDPHFANKRSIANLGVVMGQRTHLFYKPPHGAPCGQYMDGMYYALLEGRFLFDFVHEDDLGAGDAPRSTPPLILPNTALLSDEQCGSCAHMCRAADRCWRRSKPACTTSATSAARSFGLADVFGIRKAGDVVGTNGNAYLRRASKGSTRFSTASLTPSGSRAPSIACRWRRLMSPVLTVVPGFVAYPPELVLSDAAANQRARCCFKTKGASVALPGFPATSSEPCGASGHTDLSRLLQNTIRWAAGGEAPVKVEGDGIVETFAWETEAGFAVHVLNYTNPNLHHGWVRSFYPIGEQKVTMKLPADRRVTRVELLRAGTDAPFRMSDGRIEFIIPRVVDYEVAALS